MRRALWGGLVLAALSAVQAQELDSLGEPYDASPWGVDGCPDGARAGEATLCCCATGLRGSGAACGQTELLLCAIEALKTEGDDDCSDKTGAFGDNANQIWIIIAGTLVFFMQCGFAMLEAGCVRSRNTQNIIFKNLVDPCIAALGFWACGYAFAYADGDINSDSRNFTGTNNFFLMKEPESEVGQHFWFFQWAFAATASTIVSGSVAERTELKAYFIYCIVITCWIYPIVVHWVWSGTGWLSAFSYEPADRPGWNPNGMVDYAGSGVVHTVGGWAGLIGSIMVGPRLGRFEEIQGPNGEVTHGKVLPMKGQSTMLGALGAMILWFGWYGFNCGSTLAWDGINAGKVAVTTTLGAGIGGLTVTFLSRFIEGHWNVDEGLNGVLAGLVSITAACSVVDEWAACVIGMIGAIFYYSSSKFLLCMHIDDPLNAWPVHGVCGVWGCLATGIFMTERNFARAYGEDYDMAALDDGRQFGVQLLGIFCIVMWTVGNSLFMFGCIKLFVGLRVPEEHERMGLDVHHHGAELSPSFQLDPNSVVSFTGPLAGLNSRPAE